VSLLACKTAALVSKKTYFSDQHCRDDKQEFTASRDLPNRSDNNNYDDFQAVKELLSDTWQESMPTSENLNGDDCNRFIDIDELLSGVQQKGRTSADPGYGGLAVDMADNRTRGGSPTSSSRSTAESSRDAIILSDDECVSTESETDYSSLEVDLTAKSDSSTPHIAERDMVNGEGSGFGTTYISDCLVADHQDDSSDSHSGMADGARLQLAGLPRSASPVHEFVTHQASPIRVNTEIIQGSASYDGLNVTKETDDEGIDVLADDEDGAGTYPTKRSGPSAISSDNPASDSRVSLLELEDDQQDSTQSPQLCPAAASHHQSDLTNDLPPKHRRRRDDTKNVRRKPPLTRRSRTASAVSAALESNNCKHTQSVTPLAARARGQEVRDIDHEMVDRGTDDSHDEDYNDMSDSAASEIRRPPCSRKRIKRAKDMEHDDVESPSTHTLDVSYQATAATSSVNMQESEEIPIRGYLTLKTIESKVVYSLTFSQEFLQEPGGTSQRQGILKSVSSSRDRRDSGPLPAQERDINRHVRNSRFSSEDDTLLQQLKGKGLSWDEISDHFPGRSKGTLQVHYSTKLKDNFFTKQEAKPRKRGRKPGVRVVGV